MLNQDPEAGSFRIRNLISENEFDGNFIFLIIRGSFCRKGTMLTLFPLKSYLKAFVKSLWFTFWFQIIKSCAWKFCWLTSSSDPPSTSETGPLRPLLRYEHLQIRLQCKNQSVSLTVGLGASPSLLFPHRSVSAGLRSCRDSFVPQSGPVCPRFQKVSSQCLMWFCRGYNQLRHKMAGEAV